MTISSLRTAIDLEALRLRVHRAAMEPELWDDILATVKDLVGARAAQLTIFDKRTLGLAFGQVNGGDANAERLYREYWHKHDIWLHAVVGLKAGTVIVGQDVVPDRRLFASAIYNDYLKPHANDLGRVLSCITENGDGFFGAVTANRAIADEEFDEIERRVMRFLAPHFATSISVQLHLSKLENRLQATDAALDGLPVGVCLLDGTGAIAHCNRAAREILGAHDGLTERAGQLHAAAARNRRELNARIEQVVAAGLGRAGSPGAMLSIRRPSRRRPYSVLVAPLDTARDTTNGIIGHMRPCAIALISDLEREAQYPADFLAQRYGLTAPQAQLALEIAAGSPVRVAADRLEMTVETARQQLKMIYAKTEVRRQAELARLLTADLAAQASRLLGS